MPNDKLIEEVNRLRTEINRHNHLYYVLNRPEINDGQFDILLTRLRQIEEGNPRLVNPNSPTQRVGAKPAKGFAQVQHTRPMLSLSNVFDTHELVAWHSRVVRLLGMEAFDMICELKYDGLAVSLIYEDGIFVRGSTRGDGFSGEDVTLNLRTIKTIPLTLSRKTTPSHLEVRGEVYFPRSRFHLFNEQRSAIGLPTYANPRNTAAGSLRQLDPAVTSQRPLDIFIYGIPQPDDELPARHWDTLGYLRNLGFRINPYNAIVKTPNDVVEYYKTWVSQIQSLDYDCDGIVVKVDRLDYQRALGHIGRDPRWAVAYKFPASQSVTRLLDIQLTVGRTGSINPFAVLEPVEVGGATVRQATLHNEDYIQSKGLRIGDWVVIERAGEVIPKVVSVIESRRTGHEHTFQMPNTCPSCYEPIIRHQGEVTSCCVNLACPAQLVRQLEHFVSQEAMDIEGMGSKTGIALIDAGLIKNMADLYYLGRAQILSLDRMAEKSADNLLAAIELSKSRGLARVLVALGIKHVGREVANLLAKRCLNIDILMTMSEEELTSMPSIGPKIATSIVTFLHNESNIVVIRRLRKAAVKLEEMNDSTIERRALDGLRFSVTGKFQGLSRSHIGRLIRELGGSVTNTVSSRTDYLLVGMDGGSKIVDAERIGVPMVGEDDFFAMCKL